MKMIIINCIIITHLKLNTRKILYLINENNKYKLYHYHLFKMKIHIKMFDIILNVCIRIILNVCTNIHHIYAYSAT